MRIFFDTEFTGLRKNTTLVSIGMVDELGNTFYAELTDYNKKQCDEWIQENVIQHLHLQEKGWDDNGRDVTVKGNKKYVREQLTQWLAAYDYVELVADVCAHDMVLFIDLFENAFSLPRHVCPACYDICQDIALWYGINMYEAFDKSREEMIAENGYTISGDKHNALYDAIVIKTIYEITHPKP